MFTPRALAGGGGSVANSSSRSKTASFGFTPNKIGGTPAKNRRTSNIFTPRSTPFSNSFRNESFNRSMQTSRLLEETAQHRLEEFGGPLPVSITEALTLTDRAVKINVKLDPCGWAWLIFGRKLLVWNYKPTTQFAKSCTCLELGLAASALPHRVHLVCVVPAGAPGVGTGAAGRWPSCVAVSPDGVVRVWSDLSQQDVCSELATELSAGDECVSVIALDSDDVQRFSYIIATKNSNLMLLTVSITQNTVEYRPLKAPHGMLAGIGRRMSSFIFGSGAAPSLSSQFHQIVGGESLGIDTRCFYVLAGSHLQKWMLRSEMEQFVYQCDVEQFLCDCLAETVWGQEAAQLSQLKVWVLDMQATRDGVVVLGAGMNSEVSQQVHYMLGTLHTVGVVAPQSFISFTVSKFTNMYQEENEVSLLSYRLLLPDPRIASAYLYDNKTVICISVSNCNDPLDKVEFQSPGDRLLGAGQCDGMAVFFSMIHGLVSVREVSAKMDTSVVESLLETSNVVGDTSLMCNASRLHELSVSEDKASRLKAAFLHHCSGNKGEATAIVAELFPPSPLPDTSLDQLVYQLCLEMADDFPASDPRWAESVRHGGASTSGSLILIHQLTDKLKAHNYLIQFLKTLHLWQRLSTVRVGGQTSGSTRLLLLQLAEKLVATRTLRELHTQHSDVVDTTIRRLMDGRPTSETALASGLTPQDLFYREVSRIEEFCECLVAYEEETLSTDITSKQTVALVATVNTILTSVIFEAWQYRQTNAAVYESGDRSGAAATGDDAYFVPWTATTGPKGMRSLLCKQHGLTVTRLSLTTDDAHECGGLLQQLVQLTDIVLDSHRAYLDSIAAETPLYAEVRADYDRSRSQLITPFLKRKQYERAASLAEKYCDFAILVQLCEETDNQDRLQRYLNKFHNQGFSDFVFKWYIKEGKRGKLMSSQLANHPLLGKFLQTNENRFLSWVHDINNGDFHQAHLTLHSLAQEERSFLAKKKTLLSLSKLSALATEEPPDSMHLQLEVINSEQDLILNQEQLPAEVLEALGVDVDTMRVLSPEELIELYVGDYNTNANEFDFKKALDLLQFVDKGGSEYDNLLIHIWCRAILMDSWSDMSTEDPLEGSTDTIFLKTLELAHLEGANLLEVLPSVEQVLAADELGDLRENPTFQFLLRAGYEHVQRVMA